MLRQESLSSALGCLHWCVNAGPAPICCTGDGVRTPRGDILSCLGLPFFSGHMFTVLCSESRSSEVQRLPSPCSSLLDELQKCRNLPADSRNQLVNFNLQRNERQLLHLPVVRFIEGKMVVGVEPCQVLRQLRFTGFAHLSTGKVRLGGFRLKQVRVPGY